MPRRHESLHQGLIDVHWGVPVALSAVLYVGLFVVLPQFCASNACGGVLTQHASMLSNLAPIVAFMLLMTAAFFVLEAREKRRLLDPQSDLESIRKLDWKALESLIGEYYRLRGFRAQENRQKLPMAASMSAWKTGMAYTLCNANIGAHDRSAPRLSGSYTA